MDAAPGIAMVPGMTLSNSGESTPVKVSQMPIVRCQFMKFGGLSESGGAAKQSISEGKVLVNGSTETRKRRKLAAGDRVTFSGRTIVVET